MTASKLQEAARVLGNGTWCRYWLNWNIMTWPDGQSGVLMAIQCRDVNGSPQPISDAAKHGFTEHDNYFYTAPRTNDDGTHYLSRFKG